MRLRCWSWIRTAAFALILLGPGPKFLPVTAAPVLRAVQDLPFTGGPGQLAGDIVFTPRGAAAVYARVVGTESHLAFYRMGPDARAYVERVHSLAPWPCYEPAIADDGVGLGVAVSGLTQAFFLELSPTGEILAGPVKLPGLPSGAEAGRTAGFKVVWTGQGHAVFGLWLERSYPGQDLTLGPFHTHLWYWLLQRNGEVLAARELRRLSPLSYPSAEGAERNYYDAVWTGEGFMVAYSGESESGPPLSTYYRTLDPGGAWRRPESPLLAHQTAQGPRLAWSGRTVAATALKVVPLPSPDAGNYLYFRVFEGDGTPRGPEVAFGQRLGFGPTVSWIGDRFLTTYCVMHDMATLGYALLFNAFDEAGARLGTEEPLRQAQGRVVHGRMALGVDLQIVGDGNVLYGKAQNSDAFAIRTNPLWFTLENDRVVAPPVEGRREGDRLVLRWPADAASFVLQESTDVDGDGAAWTEVSGAPTFEDGDFVHRTGLEGRRFFRLRR